jgi:hypothetical protein
MIISIVAWNCFVIYEKSRRVEFEKKNRWLSFRFVGEVLFS